MVLKKGISSLDMYSILAITILVFDVVFSLETRDTNELNKQEKRERRFSGFSPVIPSEIKEQFKDYAKRYLNTIATQLSKRNNAPGSPKTSSTSRAQICAEVCQHRCLPSCEWSCCIKENIEEYRSAHLVKPLVTHPPVQRKSHLSDAEKKTSVGTSRENIEEPIPDGHECNPSCRRYCVPSCRFSCCKAVQVKGVLLI